MDMSLPEQLVWAAAFAQYERYLDLVHKDMDLDGRILSASQHATNTVVALRSAFKYAASKDSMRKHMGQQAFDHLRQMTFKADD